MTDLKGLRLKSAHKNRDWVYRTIIVAAKTWFRTGDIEIELNGFENIPTEGAALLACNHLSYVDYLMQGLPGVKRGRFTRFMAKKEIFEDKKAGPIMRGCHHLSIDRSAGAEGMAACVDALAAGEVVGIFSEGTISQSFVIKDVKTGTVRIAAEAGVPVIPVVVWGTQRIMAKGRKLDARHHYVAMSVGEPMSVTGEDPVAETAELKRRMEALLDPLIRNDPNFEQGVADKAWWLPASYGGSAPTLEEAAAAYAEELKKRAERKAERSRAQNTPA
jgi:1-acyl-sn-glycerol-3-phosphate acyltransferase